MNQQVAIIEQELSAEQQQELQKKRTGWSGFAEQVYRMELSIADQARKQIEKVKIPTEIHEIPYAEALLAQLKHAQRSIETERSVQTGTLDKLKTRLMSYEKSLDGPIKQLGEAIIVLKREHEKIENAKRAKASEAQNIIALIKSHVNAKDHEYRSMITRVVSAALQKALTDGVAPDQVEIFLADVRNTLTYVAFDTQRPDFTLRLVSPEEAEELVNEHLRRNPNAYLQIFHKQLGEAFADYPVAYANKQQAIQKAKEDEAERQRQLEEEATRKEISATLQSRIEPVQLNANPVRALKKFYVVEMPDTVESAIMIWAAFTANMKLCVPKLRTKKPLTGLTPEACANALAAVRNEDPNFQPDGINFVESDKL